MIHPRITCSDVHLIEIVHRRSRFRRLLFWLAPGLRVVLLPTYILTGLWEKALLDTDKVLQFFYDKCASAGPACPLHANSSALVQQRVESIISAIKKNPVPVVDGPDYTLLDFSALKGGLFESLYTPFSIIPLLAEALAALEEGDGRPGIVLRRMMQPLPKCDTPPVLGRFKQEPGLATQCSDAEHVANTTADILQYFENLSETSIFADAWADDTYTSCA